MIQDLLILDTDAKLFFHKTLDDLDFINISLHALLSNLKDNFRLIERDEQFHNLSETERQFCEVLSEIIHGTSSISAVQYPELREKIGLLMGRSQDRQNALQNLIVESNSFAAEPVVGHDELHELLSS